MNSSGPTSEAESRCAAINSLKHVLSSPVDAVLTDPRAAGKNLVGPRMGSYWRYRIGDVRVICDLQENALLILVVEVGHRREVYRTK